MELDPLALSRHAALGDFLAKEGRVNEARVIIQGIMNLFDSVESYRVIGQLTELIGEFDQAIAWGIRARDREPDNPDHTANLASLFTMIGDFETAISLEPEPNLWMLFQMRRYPELIDIAEFLMIEEPDDMNVRYLLAFAYNATGQFESAIHVLHSTGLPDSILNDTARSVTEIEAFHWLINALLGLDQPEAIELARSLASFSEKVPLHGQNGWIAVYKGCNLGALGRHDEALETFRLLMKSPRLFWDPVLRDFECLRPLYKNPGYQEVLQDQEDRRSPHSRTPARYAGRVWS